METALLVAAIVSGFVTMVCVGGGLRKLTTRPEAITPADVAAALFFSALTGVLVMVELLPSIARLARP